MLLIEFVVLVFSTACRAFESILAQGSSRLRRSSSPAWRPVASGNWPTSRPRLGNPLPTFCVPFFGKPRNHTPPAPPKAVRARSPQLARTPLSVQPLLRARSTGDTRWRADPRSLAERPTDARAAMRLPRFCSGAVTCPLLPGGSKTKLLLLLRT